MGSPLSSIVAEVVIGSLDQWINQTHSSDIHYWRRMQFFSNVSSWIAHEVQVSNPRISKIIREDFYVDGLLTGCPTVEDAKGLMQQLIAVLGSGNAMRHDAESDHSTLNLRSRWSLIQPQRDYFWNRWSCEYLHQLQERRKWRTSHPDVNIGDLVMLKEQNKPLQWKLARIVQIFTGEDDHVRVVLLRTPGGLLKRPITKIYETWNYGFDSETTQQTSEWRFKNEPRPKIARKATSKVKIMLTVFFEYQGMVHLEFKLRGTTITADSYLGVLRQLREAIRQKRPAFWRSKSWIFHHDNAQAHTVLKISSIEEIKVESKAMKAILKTDYQRCFSDWKKKWLKCIAANGDYFEGDNLNLALKTAFLCGRTESGYICGEKKTWRLASGRVYDPTRRCQERLTLERPTTRCGLGCMCIVKKKKNAEEPLVTLALLELENSQMMEDVEKALRYPHPTSQECLTEIITNIISLRTEQIKALIAEVENFSGTLASFKELDEFNPQTACQSTQTSPAPSCKDTSSRTDPTKPATPSPADKPASTLPAPVATKRKQPEALNPPAKRPNLKGPTKLASSRVSKPAAAQVVLHGEKSAAHTVVVSDDPQADPRDIYKAVRAVHTLPQGVWASLRTKGKLVLHSSNPDIIPEVTTSLASKLTGMKVRQQKEILPRICLFRVDEETSNSTIEETFLATAAVSQLPGNKVVRVAHRSALRNGTCTAFIEVDLKTFGALGNRGRIVVDGVILNFEASIRARVCFRCCGFGHNSTHCSRAPKCFHCGEDGHEGRSCPTRADQHTSKCANCCQKGLSGNHEARASNCPILKSKAHTF
ncbi:CLCN3 [Cordylochernes scorpioides]|uniref:CLCN3 n=1 Tax=Cordylochernes scorpioides TaxID=51811 RepID=A0ABY6LJX5_9ARAC|nr:CLCN3 [Cordylochernes scorpioides]